ncbi:scavenger receptor cysteine-rich type 1 protein M130-like [Plectropomus leopardus]|uniref:scavenger receptor cysteine-rich type 1 protein M130-like n=1 Tax=Plectropomus leopardus TaxID=160734 RepID=UPI001C4D742D|nr:scavenger receptor cysteine-rich type 1 protein M130-like [Plectropomus leopardus]
MKHLGEWRPVKGKYFDQDSALEATAPVCRELDCGPPVSVRRGEESSKRPVWIISSDCVKSGSALKDCATSDSSDYVLNLTCLDSVRLLNGTSLCSGRLEVRSDQTNQRWSSVCEAGFDLQDAEVVCRELGCGAPSVLQGALYGEVEAPKWTKEFQCEGHESALLDCRSSERNTCSGGRDAGLTCSEPVRLVGGDSRCAGTLEVKHLGKWRPVSDIRWSLTLIDAAVMCRELDCGSAVSVGRVNQVPTYRPMWEISSHCLQSGFSLRECAAPFSSSYKTDVTCSGLALSIN